MAKAKKTDQTTRTVVYVGPTVPGAANQNTFYSNGIPAALAEAIDKNPAMGGLVIPLDHLPDAMKKLRGGYGHIYRLYRLVQEKSNRRYQPCLISMEFTTPNRTPV